MIPFLVCILELLRMDDIQIAYVNIYILMYVLYVLFFVSSITPSYPFLFVNVFLIRIATMAVYDANIPVIVVEAFPYVERNIETKRVINLFKDRQKARKIAADLASIDL